MNVGVVLPANSDGVQEPPARFDLLATFQASYGANLIGCTIERIRGHLWVPVPPAATLQYRVGVKINDNATPPDAAENLYRPDEFGGAHDDWFGWYVLAAGPAAALISDNLTHQEVDIRSRRRVDELGQRVEMWASTFSGIADAEGVLAFDLSVLVALP